MNQGKIIVGVAVVLGICAGLAGYWWNYRVGHRAIEFWGRENSRLIRLAPKVEYLWMVFSDPLNGPESAPNQKTLKSSNGLLLIEKEYDLSDARGLIHLRNALLSDDQYKWPSWVMPPNDHQGGVHGLRFQDPETGANTVILIAGDHAYQLNDVDVVSLGPLAKSLEQFLARELPRAEKDAAKPEGPQPLPAKSE